MRTFNSTDSCGCWMRFGFLVFIYFLRIRSVIMNYFNFEIKVKMQNLCEVKACLGEEVKVGQAGQVGHMIWIVGRMGGSHLRGGASIRYYYHAHTRVSR